MTEQHDLNLANQTGAAFRADANLALRAISSKQWGPTAPPTLLAYMDWVDTTTATVPLWKLYDGASWLTIGAIDTVNNLWLPVIGGGTDTIASASTTDLATKNASGITVTGTTTITSFGTVPAGQIKRLTFQSSLIITYHASNMLLPGGKSVTVRAGDTCLAESLGGGAWAIGAFTSVAGLPNAGLLTEATVASATTTNIGASTSNIITISGTTTITGLGSGAKADSPLYFVRFSGALTLTHNATSLILPGGANITTADGDTMVALYLGSGNWKVLHYSKVSGQPLVSGGRERLTGNRTYYVRTDGNDSNTGLVNNAGGAFLTINKALATVADTLDTNGFSVTIQVANGSYATPVALDRPFVGGGVVTLQGDTTTPANVTIGTTASNGIILTNGVVLSLRGFTMTTTTSGSCIQIGLNSILNITGNMTFGACASYHMVVATGGKVLITSGYTISGAATNGHINVQTVSYLDIRSVTVTITGTPALGTFIIAQDSSAIYALSVTFSGSATGTRYSAARNGLIFTNGGGASYFPGNVAGATASGGQYL